MLSTLKEAHKTAKYLLKTGFLGQFARNPVVNFTTVQWRKTVSINEHARFRRDTPTIGAGL